MSDAQWKEYVTQDGRKYWHHSLTKRSTWLKPTELKSDRERLLDETPWKEYTAPGGRVYWHNQTTQTSTWILPDDYRLLLERAEAEGRLEEASSVAPSQLPATGPAGSDTQSDAGTKVSARFDGTMPIFDSKEMAESAFIQLLRDCRIGSDWTWENAMRKLIKYPMYRALNTTTERKEAFEKYIYELKKHEREEHRSRLNKLRDDFKQMLRSTEGIRSISRHRQHPAWIALTDERDRRDLIDDYVYDLKKKESDQERDVQRKGYEKMVQLLQSRPEVTEKMLWSEAQTLLESLSDYQNDETFRQLEAIDRLQAFEDHIKRLETASSDQRRLEKQNRYRQERLNRDAFKALLEEQREAGHLHIFTKWKELYPLIRHDERYTNLLTQPGSTPLDLYRDMIVRIEDEVYPERKLTQQILQEKGLEVTIDTSFESFLDMLVNDERFRSKVKPINVKNVFLVLQSKAIQRKHEDERRADKKKKKNMEELKRLFRHAKAPPLTGSSQLDASMRRQFVGRSAFDSVDEETRMEVFSHVVQRLKEKERESGKGARERSRSRGRSKREGSEDHHEHGEDSRRRRKKTKREEKPKRERDEEREEGEASTSEEEYDY